MKFKPTHIAAAVLLCAGVAHAQEYSNTLGQPGLGGSYTVGFATYDDGTGESLYTTGQFTIPGSSNIARWDGTAWQAVGGGLNGSYSNTIASFQGNLIAGGYFNDAGGVPGTEKLARWDGSAWHSMDAQSSSFLNSIWDLEVFDDGVTGEQLYIAGNYVNLNGQVGLDHIAKWDGSTYTPVGGTIGGAVPLIVLDLTQADLGDGNKLYAGGRFLTIGGTNAKNIAVWDGTSWADIGGGLSRNAGFAQVLHMLAWDDGNGMALYAGGRFNLANGVAVSTNIAKWDGTQWSSMGDGFDADVQELVAFDDGSGEALYAMGNFTTSGPTVVNHIAKWNGSSWEPVGNGTNNTIFGGTVYDTGEGNSIVMGGSFTMAGDKIANRVAAYVAAANDCPADLNGDGNIDFFDVSMFLNAFTAQDSIADFDDNGMYNFFDVSLFLNAFTAGCP